MSPLPQKSAPQKSRGEQGQVRPSKRGALHRVPFVACRRLRRRFGAQEFTRLQTPASPPTQDPNNRSLERTFQSATLSHRTQTIDPSKERFHRARSHAMSVCGEGRCPNDRSIEGSFCSGMADEPTTILRRCSIGASGLLPDRRLRHDACRPSATEQRLLGTRVCP